MASEVDICNLGLAHLGAETLITAINPPDGTQEANYARIFYPQARRELIELGSFAFATKRVLLSPLADNPSQVWQFAYVLPSDCMSPLRVLQQKYLSEAGLLVPYGTGFYNQFPQFQIEDLFSERGSSLFEVEGSTLFTNEPEAVLKYKTDVTDTSKFPPLFVTTMGMLMASYLAGPVIKGDEGRRISAGWRESAMAEARLASQSDANNERGMADHTPAHVRARA